VNKQFFHTCYPSFYRRIFFIKYAGLTMWQNSNSFLYRILLYRICTLGGFNFILFFWNFNKNHTEIDRYWQKNNFLLFAKCLKMYSFFRICILRLQKVLLWPKFFFLEKYQYGYQKHAEFYADFKFIDADLYKCP
jgi:hypothetical protein